MIIGKRNSNNKLHQTSIKSPFPFGSAKRGLCCSNLDHVPQFCLTKDQSTQLISRVWLLTDKETMRFSLELTLYVYFDHLLYFVKTFSLWNKYHLLTEFAVRTARYGPSFFRFSRAGHKSEREKTKIRNLQYVLRRTEKTRLVRYLLCLWVQRDIVHGD